MLSIVRIAAAVALTFAFGAAVPQGALAATKHHHHAAKTSQTVKPSEQYLRSAAPPAGKAQQ